jgi:hypothetical protein
MIQQKISLLRESSKAVGKISSLKPIKKETNELTVLTTKSASYKPSEKDLLVKKFG